MTAQPRTMPFLPQRKLPPFLEGLQCRADLLGPCAGAFLLTPEVAARWVEERNAGNRPQNVAWIRSLGEAIRRGEWKLNGEAIVFEGRGENWKMVNGQHRSMAVASSGMSVWVWVIWGDGVDPDSFFTFDLNRRRSGADALAIQDHQNFKLLSSALSLHYQYRVGKFGTGAGLITPALILAEANNFPGMVESVTWVAGHNKRSPIIAPSFSSVLHFTAGKNFLVEVEDFLVRLLNATDIPADSALHALRQRLDNNVKATGRLSRTYLFAILIKAWNLHISGQTVKYMRWMEGQEPFPKIIDS